MKRLTATLVAAVLFVASFLTPAGDVIVGALSMPWRPVGTIQDLNYNTSPERILGAETYPFIASRTPPDVTRPYVMGSSDFWADLPQNPRTFLTKGYRGYDMYSSGTDGTEILQHAVELVAQADVMPRRRVVLMLSPQWFSAGGLTPSYARGRFSLTLWRRFAADPRVSADARARLQRRLVGLAPDLCDAFVDCPERPDADPTVGLARPFAIRGEELRERWNEARIDRAFDTPYPRRPGKPSIDSVDWDAEMLAADDYGRAHSHNELLIDDAVYRKSADVIAGRLTNYQRSYRPESPSYDDLALFLRLAREVDVRVLVVSAPANGRWEDLTGFVAPERAAHYRRIRDIVAAGGGELLDLSDHEYEPYFFQDLIHLGPKGWLYVIRGTYAFARA